MMCDQSFGNFMRALEGDFVKTLGSRGTLEILFIFCCTDKILRFMEINNLMNHISTKTLTTKLKNLEKEGILIRTAFNEIPPRVEYSLSMKGQGLMDSLMPLVRWISENQ